VYVGIVVHADPTALIRLPESAHAGPTGHRKGPPAADV